MRRRRRRNKKKKMEKKVERRSRRRRKEKNYEEEEMEKEKGKKKEEEKNLFCSILCMVISKGLFTAMSLSEPLPWQCERHREKRQDSRSEKDEETLPERTDEGSH